MPNLKGMYTKCSVLICSWYIHSYICIRYRDVCSLCCSHYSCVSSNNIAPEGKYPAIFDENSDPVVLGKIKRIKSMQPKSLDEEEITRSGKLNGIIQL